MSLFSIQIVRHGFSNGFFQSGFGVLVTDGNACNGHPCPKQACADVLSAHPLRHDSIYKLVPEEVIKEMWES